MSSIQEINQYVMRGTLEGRIDRDMGVEILKRLASKRERMEMAIIGIECTYSQAADKHEFWEHLLSGRSSLRSMPTARAHDVEESLGLPKSGPHDYFAPMGYLDRICEFDAGFFRISPKEALGVDPKQRLFLEAIQGAVEDAGYAGVGFIGSRTGIFVGVDHLNDMDFPYKVFTEQSGIISQTGAMPGLLAGRPSYVFDLSGPAVVYDTACSSSLVALHAAAEAIADGSCDMAIAGGVNVSIYTRGETRFEGVESATSRVRTFDRGANGTNWGEGAAAILIKPLDKAVADGDNIYAVLKSVAVNNDGATNGVTAPSAAAQERVLVEAWQQAQIRPEELSYIEAHGTGTLVGDQIEHKSLSKALARYSDRRQFCGFGSLKPNIGHTVGASGMAGLIKVALAMRNGLLPPSVNFDEPNPAIEFADSPLYLVDRLTRWKSDDGRLLAGVSSFGFSGTNCHAVLASPPTATSTSTVDPRELFTLSTHDQSLLGELVDRYRNFLALNPETGLADLCFTANAGRRHHKWRVALMVRDLADLRGQLDKATDELAADADIPAPSGSLVHDDLLALEHAVGEFLSSGRRDLAALDEIARAYRAGLDIDWDDFYRGCGRRRISLPTAPRLRTKFWAHGSVQRRPDLRSASHADELYLGTPGWRLTEPASTVTAVASWLILHEGRALDRAVVARLRALGQTVTEMVTAAGQGWGDAAVVLDPTDPDAIEAVLDPLRGGEHAPTRVLYLWAAGPAPDSERGYLALLRLIRALGRDSRRVRLTVLTPGALMARPRPDDQAPPFAALAAAPALVGSREFGQLDCRQVDLDADSVAEPTGEVIDRLLAEAAHDTDDRQVAYLGEARLTPSVTAIDEPVGNEPAICSGGLYLLTGGLGGIGAALATALVEEYGARVVLTGTSALPPAQRWSALSRDPGTDTRLREQLATLTRLRRADRVVEYHAAAVDNRAAMAAVVEDCERRLGSFDGVFHLAGLSKGSMIGLHDQDQSSAVLAAKVDGTLLLAELFEQRQLDFLMLFSSVSSLVGPTGLVDYVAGCSFLDAYAASRGADGKRVISVNWDSWRDVGMAARTKRTDHRLDAQITEALGPGISTADGVRAIVAVLSGTAARYVVTARPADRLLRDLDGAFDLLKPEDTNAREPEFERPDLGTPYVAPETELQHVVAAVFGKVFSIRAVGIDDSFYELGGDSLMALNITSALSDGYGMEVTDLFTYPSVRELADYLGGRDLDLRSRFDTAKEWLARRADEAAAPQTPHVRERLESYRERVRELVVADSPTTHYRNVLLLGATGFVGSYILHELLEQTDSDIHVLVRPTQVPIGERLAAAYSRYFPDVDLTLMTDRVAVYEGDVMQPKLGLSDDLYADLAVKIDAICNSAGRVDHYGEIEEFRAANVEPVRRLIEFAQTGIEKHIHQVSTIATRGSLSDRDEIYTEFDRDIGQAPLNVYAGTKAEAEALLAAAQANGLHVNNYRLGFVCGDSRTGNFQAAIDTNGLYLISRALYELDVLPTDHIGFWEFNMVDELARQLVAIMGRAELLDNAFHLINGHAVDISQLKAAFAAVGRSHREVDRAKFMEYLYENHDDPSVGEYVRDFLLHSHLLEAPRLVRLRVENEWTNSVLHRLGLGYRPVTTDELAVLFRYCQRVGFFTQADIEAVSSSAA